MKARVHQSTRQVKCGEILYIWIFTHPQVVHYNKLPIVVTVIATTNANTGHLMDMDKEISILVSQLTNVVDI